MKYFIPVFLALFAISARAQITLEHTYFRSNGDQFGLVEIDSAVWKYIQNNYDTIRIFNLDHSLEKVIQIPAFGRPEEDGAEIMIIAKNLFTTDGSYAYLLFSADSLGDLLRVFKEDGTVLFGCENCQLTQNIGRLNGSPNDFPTSPIIATDSGTKMLVQDTAFEVYALPGKLPSRSITAYAGVTPSMAYNPTLPTSAYPNPSTGLVRIAYQLPPGVSSGEVILTTEDGTEVKRYRVTSAFSDLEIEESDLPSGSYFYRLVTTQGESAAQRIVLAK